MNLLMGVLTEIIFLIFFTAFGMVLMPSNAGKSQEDERKVSSFLISPLVGFAIWIAFTCCLGMFLPYNRVFLLVLFSIAIAFIWYRRKNLYLPKHIGMWCFVFVVFVISVFIIYAVLPLTTDDGIYFSMSAADNTRVCLVNSIVREGLPPINPYLTYNGELLPAYYHFGLVAFAAQPVIVCGLNSIVANTVTNGLSVVFVMFIAGSICYRFIRNNTAFLLVSIFFMISAPSIVLHKILPLSIQNILYPHESFIGFFPFIGEVTFSPHNVIASALTILMMHFYEECISTEDAKIKYHYSVLIGIIGAAAFYNSVYGGILASAILEIGRAHV